MNKSLVAQTVWLSCVSDQISVERINMPGTHEVSKFFMHVVRLGVVASPSCVKTLELNSQDVFILALA